MKCVFQQIEPGLLRCEVCGRDHRSNNPPEFVKRDCKIGPATGGPILSLALVARPKEEIPKKKCKPCGAKMKNSAAKKKLFG